MALHLTFEPEDITLAMVVGRLPQLLRSSREGVLARLTFITWIFSVWEERNAGIFELQSRTKPPLHAAFETYGKPTNRGMKLIWGCYKLGEPAIVPTCSSHLEGHLLYYLSIGERGLRGICCVFCESLDVTGANRLD